jgi:UDP-glucose 4-epimerase
MVLVTGGAGYIGSHFIQRFLTRNPQAEIVTVDNLSEGHVEAVSHSPRIHFVQADINQSDVIADLLTRYDIRTVVHFAASCYVGESQEKPEKYFENNVVKTLSLLKTMEACGVRRMVFSSTCATYGHPQRLPIDENHPQAPINVYGSTKLMIEQALHAYALSKGWSYVALRYFNAAGADESGLLGECHEPETHLIPLILQTAAGRRDVIQVYGTDYDTPDGTCIRDYIHVNDLADAHLKALDYLDTHSGGEVFNLGTAHGASVLEVLEACREVTGQEIPVVYGPRRPGDPARLIANADKARQLLGWVPEYDLKRTVETAWHWEQRKTFGNWKDSVPVTP